MRILWTCHMYKKVKLTPYTYTRKFEHSYNFISAFSDKEYEIGRDTQNYLWKMNEMIMMQQQQQANIIKTLTSTTLSEWSAFMNILVAQCDSFLLLWWRWQIFMFCFSVGDQNVGMHVTVTATTAVWFAFFKQIFQISGVK